MAEAVKVRSKPRGAKPKAPRGCPLWLHPTGQWSKKIKGRMYYFGRELEPALARWADEGPALLAGRPRPGDPQRVTTRELVNQFLTLQKSRMESGELSRATWGAYYTHLGVFIDAIDADSAVANLGPVDFERARAALAKGVGPVTLGKRVQSVRTLFKWSWESGRLDKPVRFGTFRKPSAGVLRRDRASKGARTFTAAEVRGLLEAARESASPWLHPVVLLGINAGLGAGDCAALEGRHVEGDVLDFPRPKSGIPRRAVLWPETLEAIAAWEPLRPAPAEDADGSCLFLTSKGHPLTRAMESRRTAGQTVFHDAVRLAFDKVGKAAGVVTTGRGFYGLRATFRSVCDELADRPAVDVAMGHAPAASDVRQHYVRSIAPARLRAVSEHVWTWLFAEGGAK